MIIDSRTLSKKGSKMAKTISFPAIECFQNGKKFYSATIDSEILKQTCFVSRRDTDPRLGFQRLLNDNRAKDITRYLEEEKGVIPSAIILSAQDQAKLTYNNSKVMFTISEKAFLVLDGQHRLFGFFYAKNSYTIPVIIFNKLTSAEEVSLFIDINTKQKGVPSALLLDIKQLAGKETKREERQRDLFNQLNENSPLAGYLSATKSVKGKISRSAFNEATSVIFDSGPLSDQLAENIYKGVKNYLEAAEYVFALSKSENAKLTKTTLFKALFIIFNEVMNRCLQEKGNLKKETIIEVIKPISNLNFDDYMGTNKVTIDKIVSDMRAEVNRYELINEEMF